MLDAVGSGEASLTASERVLQRLRSDVLEGRLPPGTRLKIDELASELSVSHMPVREALHLLVVEGLATRIPRRGVVVRSLSAEDVVSAYSVLGVLEGLATRYAAEHLQAGELKALGTVLDSEAVLVARDDRDGLRALNQTFHGRLQETYPNAWSAAFVRQLRNYTYRLRRLYPQSVDRLHQVAAEHRAILAALAVHDGDAAERLVRRHNERACAELVQHLAADQKDSVQPQKQRRRA